MENFPVYVSGTGNPETRIKYFSAPTSLATLQNNLTLDEDASKSSVWVLITLGPRRHALPWLPGQRD